MSITSFLGRRRARKGLRKFTVTLKSYLESPAGPTFVTQLAEQGQRIDFEALEASMVARVFGRAPGCAEKEVTGWKSERPLFVPSGSLSPVADALAAAHSDIIQLKFLLASAPMMDAPSKYEGPSWFKRAITPFGYMHPKTMAQYQWIGDKVPNGVVTMPGSNTRWVLTSLMPENRVILSPFQIPGLEKIMTR